VKRAVLDLRLLGQVVGVFDWRQHAFNGKKGGQVGGVRRDDDESEEPPHTADHTPRHRPEHSRQPASLYELNHDTLDLLNNLPNILYIQGAAKKNDPTPKM